MLDDVGRHFVNPVRVAGTLFVENTRPDQRINFVLRLKHGCSVYKEVEVQVFSDGKQVIFDVLELFVSAENVDGVHLITYECVERLYDVVGQLHCKLVFFEVSQSLVDEPHVHVGN